MQGCAVHVQVQSAVLHTSSSLCNIDFGAPSPAEVPKRKLRRMAGGNPEALGRAGQNFRVFALENPCLLCEYTGSKAVLLVRRSLFQCIKRPARGQGSLAISCMQQALAGRGQPTPSASSRAARQPVDEFMREALQRRACAIPTDCAAILHASLLPLPTPVLHAANARVVVPSGMGVPFPQVERPWAEVMKAFPPPLYRHRYGT